MSVTSCHKRLVEFLSEVGNFEIDVYQVVVRVDIREVRTAFEEVVVVNRLYLQIVVEGSNFLNLLFTLAADNSADQLARLTGTSDNQAFAVLL